MKPSALFTAVLFSVSTSLAIPAVAEERIHRPQQVRPLPGQLDNVLMLNDNNPELIKDEGILLSTFPDAAQGGLNVPLNGRFDLFSHHVYAGSETSLDSTLWIAVLAAPLGNERENLQLLEGSTALSQATQTGQTAAPFLPLPALMRESTDVIAAGPGSRVAGDLLSKRRAKELSTDQWTLKPGEPTLLMALPIPVQGLDPLLNGRNLQLRLHSSGPVAIATVAAIASNDRPPATERLVKLLRSGKLSSKEHQPTPRGAKGKMIYSRVSGVQIGSNWRSQLSDPASQVLDVPREPVSWPISSLERGTLGTDQVQTAELEAFYPGTAWAAHGNYGVTYDLTLPLKNNQNDSICIELALESPLKSDRRKDSLSFRTSRTGPVMFRGPIEVAGLDDQEGRPLGLQKVHLVLRQGDQGPALGQLRLAPGQTRNVRVRFIYPADATPPQVLTIRPVKQSRASSVQSP